MRCHRNSTLVYITSPTAKSGSSYVILLKVAELSTMLSKGALYTFRKQSRVRQTSLWFLQKTSVQLWPELGSLHCLLDISSGTENAPQISHGQSWTPGSPIYNLLFHRFPISAKVNSSLQLSGPDLCCILHFSLSLTALIQAMNKTCWLSLQNAPRIWPLLMTSSAVNWATIISCLNVMIRPSFWYTEKSEADVEGTAWRKLNHLRLGI